MNLALDDFFSPAFLIRAKVRIMPTRASKLNEMEEVNSAAARIAFLTTGQKPEPPQREKNAAAVALSKLGASKGGKARAEKLTAAKRKSIARKAALSRWKNKK